MRTRAVLIGGPLLVAALVATAAVAWWPSGAPARHTAASGNRHGTTTSTTSTTTVPPPTTLVPTAKVVPVVASEGQLQLAPNPAIAGRYATLHVRPIAPFDSGAATVDFGDGTDPVPEHDLVWNGHCGGTSWDEPHVWRRPGTYHVVVTVNGCLSYGYVDNDKVEKLSLDVRVVPGNPASNGPGSPYAAIPVGGSGDHAMTIHASVDAGDGDGWITTISLDWGDGSLPAVVHESLATCDDHGGAQYPSSSV